VVSEPDGRSYAAFNRFRASIANPPVYSEEEMEADIAEAVAAVRAGWRIEGETDGL
jgi:hypothetical protein